MSNPISFQSMHRYIVQMLIAALGCLLLPTFVFANDRSDSFKNLSVRLQPSLMKGALPAWASTDIIIQPNSDSVLIPVPALASQDEIGCFALTILFEDNGDGGPVVEWIPKEGVTMLLSAGLGETGVALGLNARTLLITQSLALDGGTLRVSYAGRFSRLISASLRPARELSIAALGLDFFPSLAAENESLLDAAEVSGADETPHQGDSTEGQVIHAELSLAPKQLDAGLGGGMEFVLPLAAKPQGSLLQTEVAGLDPESWIEVCVNGESLGALGMAPFSFNAPSTIYSESGRVLIAGWRRSSLFIPARLWHEGDNSMIFTLHRAAGDGDLPLYLRKTRVDLHFLPNPIQAPVSTPRPISPTSNATPTSSETLSSGNLYGYPSPSLFHASPPLPLSLTSPLGK